MMGHISLILLYYCQNIVTPGILVLPISIEIVASLSLSLTFTVHQMLIYLSLPFPQKYDMAKHMQQVFPESFGFVPEGLLWVVVVCVHRSCGNTERLLQKVFLQAFLE